ncbi:MAG TPA: heavy-metal-associated domain-containing protein [Firmicutes bacterium]|nr:heavy-metal-associated domain-containing protein [Bacillota bacterium]
MKKAKFSVPDMSCQHCKMAITKSVNGLKGVRSCEVDLGSKVVVVEYDETATSAATIRSAIADAGYTPSELT